MAQQHYEEDRFVGGILQLAQWAQKNTRSLVFGLIAGAIVVFGLRYYFDYQKQVDELASSELRGIRLQLQTGDASSVVEGLRAFLAQYDASGYAREARVLLAHSLLLQNRAAEAVEPARAAADDIGGELLSTRAGFLLADAYEEIGDTALAISVYDEIGRREANRLQRTRALEARARLLSVSGDRAGAAAAYEELVELTPEDAPVRVYYQLLAAEMRAQPLAAATPASTE
jgi:predicted negative regulator of RcsB-dependent stress response